MNIPYSFLVCSIIVELCCAQTINLNALNNYLRIVQSAVWDKVRAYGLSNLPDVDVDMYYNITDGKGYDIKGTLHMEDGFVMDIGDILLIQKRTNYRIEKGTASIETNIEFKGISFCRDFRFTADEPDKIPDQTIGSMIIKPEEFFFSVQIMHDLVKNTVKCAMDTRYQGGASKKSLNFYPKNTLTARLRKGLPYSVSMFDDIGSSWQPIIEPFLNEVIKVIPFPSIEYPVDRMTFRVNRNCVSLNCPDCSINSNN